MKKIIYTTLAVLTLLVGIALLQTPEALAAPKDQICAGVNVVSGGSGCTAGDAQVNKIVDAIINVFSIVVGITAVIMIMVGGFKFVTANGDAGAVASARKTIAYAIVGLVVVAMAQFIVQFVLNKL
ncbi:MAG TPA: hypothetical protein VLF43_04375 [Candidatus Saccharimonadales bacterium]|nr:hypothetical protein [Candidatus Saccharimonadales bacterium]